MTDEQLDEWYEIATEYADLMATSHARHTTDSLRAAYVNNRAYERWRPIAITTLPLLIEEVRRLRR